MDELNICAGCAAEIIQFPPDMPHWRVEVIDPNGFRVATGPFCLGCMIELAKLGVRLHDAPG